MVGSSPLIPVGTPLPCPLDTVVSSPIYTGDQSTVTETGDKSATKSLSPVCAGLIDTWDRIPDGIIDEATDQWQTRLHACVQLKTAIFYIPPALNAP